MDKPELIYEVEKIVHDEARLKKRQLAEMLEVTDTNIFKIFHDRLGLTKISARRVSRMLTSTQKQ